MEKVTLPKCVEELGLYISEESLKNYPWMVKFRKAFEDRSNQYSLIWVQILSTITRDNNKAEQFLQLINDDVEKVLQGTVITLTNICERYVEIVEKDEKKLEELDPNFFLNLDDEIITLSDVEERIKTKIDDLRRHTEKDELKEAIEDQKVRLDELWDLCECTGQVKSDFPLVYTVEYTHENYQTFKTEIEKWEKYYEQHKETLELVKKFENLLKQIWEMQVNQNPKELYHNRGAKLLAETRRVSAFTHRIKKTREKLLQKANEYSLTNQEFLIRGKTIDAFLCKPDMIKAIPEESVSNGQPATSPKPTKTPSGGCIKKRPLTEPSHPRKKQFLKKGTTAPKYKLAQAGITLNKKMAWRPSAVSMRMSFPKEESWSDNYSDFEKEVTEKKVPRSTIIPKDL